MGVFFYGRASFGPGSGGIIRLKREKKYAKPMPI